MQRDLYGHLKLKEEFTPSEKLINSIFKSLNDKKLITKYGITVKDIERISEILPFCTEEKTEADILALIGLKRKSSKLATTIKACIEADWLTLQQRNNQGIIISNYITTESGKKVLGLGED
jgi:hypothetical protein